MSITDFISSVGPELTAQGLSPESVRIAIAHAGLETRYGTIGSSRSPTTFNFWNLTAGQYWDGPTIQGGDTDAAGIPIRQDWRVYDSPSEAARDYIALLSLPRYLAAKTALDNGDADSFVRALSAAGYFALNVDEYLRRFNERLAEVPAIVPPESTDGSATTLSAVVAASLVAVAALVIYFVSKGA